MRPEIELLADDDHGRVAATVFPGARWAFRLALAWALGFALIAVARWQEGSPSRPGGPGNVVQEPVPSEPFPSAVRSATNAPDPGDNPP